MKKLIITIIVTALALSGCSNNNTTNNTSENDTIVISVEENTNTTESATNTENVEVQAEVIEATLIEDTATPVDPKELIDLNLKPNESGRIMILMYHNIGETERDWVRTPENFYKDLKTLYEKGYRPISLNDYVKGNIVTEAGYTPVVITFDDTNHNNFRYLEDGSIDPTCAVGILMKFKDDYPDFPLEVTFFADGPVAFDRHDLESKKIQFLLEHGMDIGNHTEGHNKLINDKTPEQIQRYIGKQAQHLEALTGDPDYRVNTLARPYGMRPSDESLEAYLVGGEYDGVPYENVAILNVGSNPSYSPYDQRMNIVNLPRIRASELNVGNLGIYSYIEYFDNHPEKRFISDGQVEVITVPEGFSEYIVVPEGKELFEYQIQE